MTKKEKQIKVTKKDLENMAKKLPATYLKLPVRPCADCKEDTGLFVPAQNGRWGAYSPWDNNEFLCWDCFVKRRREEGLVIEDEMTKKEVRTLMYRLDFALACGFKGSTIEELDEFLKEDKK